RGDEVDRARRGRHEDVARAGECCGECADGMWIVPPEPAYRVAVAIIPFKPWGGETAELVASGADVPGLGDQYAISQQRVGGNLAEQGGLGVEAIRGAAQYWREIEAEAVDAGLGDKMAQAVED